MGERNQQILKSIEKGKVPILPIELTIATEALGLHIDKQGKLSKQLGEMMTQSSETWHDNAPKRSYSQRFKNTCRFSRADHANN